MGTSSGFKTWYPVQCGVKNQLAMINMLSKESLIGGENVNSSTDLQSTRSLLEMSTPNIESALDDDKLYKFKEGDFKRLRIQDIEDILLLLVQGKLTNLTVEERFAFNVSLRMFPRSIVIQRRMEDLQLSVESYQKKLNLTNPNTYRSDLKHKEAYTAYSNPRRFIYHNKDKQNMLMRIDELHKFSDGTLNDVRTALDDRLKAKDEDDHAKSGKVRWWEIVRERLQDATTDHMIYHMLSLSYKVTSAQDGKDHRMAKRDYAWLIISWCSRSHPIQVKEQAQDQKSRITTTNSQDKD
nr:hypothetical protein [Tanacetum cinerariifolium]